MASSTSNLDDWIRRASSGPEPLNALNVSPSRSCNRLSVTLWTRFSASCSRPATSWPIAVRSTVMSDPLRSIVSDASSGGTRSTYCSPIADTLLTVAVTFSGTGVPLFNCMCATTPVSDRPTDVT